MRRLIVFVLEVGILLGALAGILFAVRIIAQQTIGGSWYWAGAIAAFTAPVAFALALFVYERSNTALAKKTEGSE